MPQLPPSSPIWLIQPDRHLRADLAAKLRVDWSNVVEFASGPAALAALASGQKPAVMVTEPPSGVLTKQEFFEQATAFAPRATIIFTPMVARAETLPNGAHVFAHPLDSPRLSGFIRLIGGRPAITTARSPLDRSGAPRPPSTARPVQKSQNQTQGRR